MKNAASSGGEAITNHKPHHYNREFIK